MARPGVSHKQHLVGLLRPSRLIYVILGTVLGYCGQAVLEGGGGSPGGGGLSGAAAGLQSGILAGLVGQPPITRPKAQFTILTSADKNAAVHIPESDDGVQVGSVCDANLNLGVLVEWTLRVLPTPTQCKHPNHRTYPHRTPYVNVTHPQHTVHQTIW